MQSRGKTTVDRAARTGLGRTRQENWDLDRLPGLLRAHMGGTGFNSARQREGSPGWSVHYHTRAHCYEPLGVIYVSSL